jgi:hypothetical protein
MPIVARQRFHGAGRPGGGDDGFSRLSVLSMQMTCAFKPRLRVARGVGG